MHTGRASHEKNRDNLSIAFPFLFKSVESWCMSVLVVTRETKPDAAGPNSAGPIIRSEREAGALARTGSMALRPAGRVLDFLSNRGKPVLAIRTLTENGRNRSGFILNSGRHDYR